MNGKATKKLRTIYRDIICDGLRDEQIVRPPLKTSGAINPFREMKRIWISSPEKDKVKNVVEYACRIRKDFALVPPPEGTEPEELIPVYEAPIAHFMNAKAGCLG